MIYQHHKLKCLLWETSMRDPSWEKERQCSTSTSHGHMDVGMEPFLEGLCTGTEPWDVGCDKVPWWEQSLYPKWSSALLRPHIKAWSHLNWCVLDCWRGRMAFKSRQNPSDWGIYHSESLWWSKFHVEIFPWRDDTAVSREHTQGKQPCADYCHAAVYQDPLWFLSPDFLWSKCWHTALLSLRRVNLAPEFQVTKFWEQYFGSKVSGSLCSFLLVLLVSTFFNS